MVTVGTHIFLFKKKSINGAFSFKTDIGEIAYT